MKFEIYYNSGTHNCFWRVEEFADYDEAIRAVVDCNKYGVVYPELLKITRL